MAQAFSMQVFASPIPGPDQGSTSFDCKAGAPPKACHPDRRLQYAVLRAQIADLPDPSCHARNRGSPVSPVPRSTRAVRRSKLGSAPTRRWPRVAQTRRGVAPTSRSELGGRRLNAEYFLSCSVPPPVNQNAIFVTAGRVSV